MLTCDLRASQNSLPPAIKSFMAEIQSVIKQYNLDKNFWYNGLSGGGISCSYQFYIPTNEESNKDMKKSNRLILSVSFPAPEEGSTTKPTSTENDFYSHTSHLDASHSVYWSLTYGENVPKEILESFISRLK
jgi:hypothetical protein